MIDSEFNGKKVLVTGGTHGIGSAITNVMAQSGAKVAFLSRSRERLLEQSKVLEKHSIEFLPIQCDVLDASKIEDAWKKIEDAWDGIDILVNNVGGGGRWGTLEIVDTPISTWSEVIQKNLGASYHFTMLSLPYMVKNKWGRVINITSLLGNYIGGRPWFNVAKVAQSTLIKNLAQQKSFVRNGITFNNVAPGAIMIPETGWANLKETSPIEYTQFVDKLPLGRMGTPSEVASLVKFLCTEEARYINGSSITVDGGESSNL